MSLQLIVDNQKAQLERMVMDELRRNPSRLLGVLLYRKTEYLFQVKPNTDNEQEVFITSKGVNRRRVTLRQEVRANLVKKGQERRKVDLCAQPDSLYYKFKLPRTAI